MSEREPKTAGIAPAKQGALAVLQFARPTLESGHEELTAIESAADEVAHYHAPSGDQAARQAARHKNLSASLSRFLKDIVHYCPPGPERSTAISRAREAKMWASAAVALEGK